MLNTPNDDRRTPSPTFHGSLHMAMLLAAAREVGSDVLASHLEMIALELRTGATVPRILELLVNYIEFVVTAGGPMTEFHQTMILGFTKILADAAIHRPSLGGWLTMAMMSTFRAEKDSSQVRERMTRLGVLSC